MSKSPRRDRFQVSAVTLGCVVLLGATSAVQAQQTQQLDTVVVTGIRKGIEDAISVKKNKDSIVESISAEDIGKLPDASVAESIARLPGVTAQRTAGRAQQISIRGMAPDFSTALLNGREQVTTGDSRGVEFDQFPSELLSGVDIYKTPDGALVGQGLSGTVDLKTVRPLSFGKRAIYANYRTQKTGEGLPAGQQGDGDRMSAAYVDQFFDRTLGVALGWARFTEDGAATNRFEGWGTQPGTFNGVTATAPAGFNSWRDQTVQTRTGTMGVLQFKPNKSFETSLDLFFSEFEKDKSAKGFQIPLINNYNCCNYSPDAGRAMTAGTQTGGYWSAGTMSNARAVVRNDSESTNDELRSIGWNTKFKTGSWTLEADVSTSNAKRTGGILETTAGQPGNATGLGTISWTGFDGNNPGSATYTLTQNYSDPNVARLTDVMGWGGGVNLPQAGYSKLPFVEDDLKAVRLGGRYDFGDDFFFNSVDFGVNNTQREKTRAYVEGRLVIANSTDPYASVAMPSGGTVTVSGIPIATWDPRGSVGSVYTVAAKRVRDIVNKDWRVNEDVTTAFLKGNLDTQWLGLPVRGNVGLQLVRTEQGSDAFNVDGSACPGDVCGTRPNSVDTSFNDVLPSANLVVDLGNDQVLRLGLARVMARPTLNDMRASLGFSVQTVNGVTELRGDSGNPELKPFRANALDIAYEKYWGNKAYVSAAAFHKDLRTYILRKDVRFDFAPFVTTSTPLPPTGATVGTLNLPVNGSGGTIRGIELAASLPLEMLWKPLSGFGLVATYANTSSSLNLDSTGFSTADVQTGTIPLPGLSKRISSLQVYYERSGFQIRVAQRKRSDFVGEVSDFTGDRRLTYIKGETILDAQLGYEFQSGWFKGLSVLLQGYNLGNEPFVRYRNTPSNEIENTKYGKTYLLGVNYKL